MKHLTREEALKIPALAEFERWAEKGRSKAFGEGQHESAPRAICMAAVDAVRAAKEHQ